MVTFLGLLALVVPTSLGHAAPNLYCRDVSDFGLIIERAMEFADSKFPRQTIPEYSKAHNIDVASKTAATGRLKCPGSTGSANLVGKNDVLLISGHSLVDYRTCKVAAAAHECTFQVEGHQPIKVSNLIKSGSKCPQTGEADGDWAILKLERPVDGVKPYKIKPRKPDEAPTLHDVIAVAAQSSDFKRRDPKTGSLVEPKHIQNCSINRIFYVYNPYGLGTKCAQSHGASGGALLDPDLSEPTIVGLITGTSLSKEEGEQEIRTGKPIRRNYNDTSFYAVSLGIDGVLYEALDVALR